MKLKKVLSVIMAIAMIGTLAFTASASGFVLDESKIVILDRDGKGAQLALVLVNTWDGRDALSGNLTIDVGESLIITYTIEGLGDKVTGNNSWVGFSADGASINTWSAPNGTRHNATVTGDGTYTVAWTNDSETAKKREIDLSSNTAMYVLIDDAWTNLGFKKDSTTDLVTVKDVKVEVSDTLPPPPPAPPVPWELDDVDLAFYFGGGADDWSDFSDSNDPVSDPVTINGTGDYSIELTVAATPGIRLLGLIDKDVDGKLYEDYGLVFTGLTVNGVECELDGEIKGLNDKGTVKVELVNVWNDPSNRIVNMEIDNQCAYILDDGARLEDITSVVASFSIVNLAGELPPELPPEQPPEQPPELPPEQPPEQPPEEKPTVTFPPGFGAPSGETIDIPEFGKVAVDKITWAILIELPMASLKIVADALGIDYAADISAAALRGLIANFLNINPGTGAGEAGALAVIALVAAGAVMFSRKKK